MGVGVSGWQLARAVSEQGHLGVVSGTALDVVMVRRLQTGDEGGHVRRALDALPISGAAKRIVDRYFFEGGKADDARFAQTSMNRHQPSRGVEELIVAGNFVEVFLAKEGHSGLVGINYLEKIQAPTLPSIYGAMLAGVDYVLMGAGIPKTIPIVLDELAAGLPVDMRLNVKGATADDDFHSHFDPERLMDGSAPALDRPDFLAIVSSHVLAVMLATKTEIPVDGFIVESAVAGGHNAPPRGKMQLNEEGEPVYGDRDIPDVAVFVELGLPFWLAGGYSSPDRVREALDAGATGVQVGTAFAFCHESGFDADIKRQVIDLSLEGSATVFTDPLASPSGFPFKVVELPGSLSDLDVFAERTRVACELGYLRSAYRTDAGEVGWRCEAEPTDEYVRKGGVIKDTAGRMCLCNGLLANVGLGQVQRSGKPEPTLVTAGDGVRDVARYLPPGADTYSAAEVIEYLLPGAS